MVVHSIWPSRHVHTKHGSSLYGRKSSPSSYLSPLYMHAASTRNDRHMLYKWAVFVHIGGICTGRWYLHK